MRMNIKKVVMFYEIQIEEKNYFREVVWEGEGILLYSQRLIIIIIKNIKKKKIFLDITIQCNEEFLLETFSMCNVEFITLIQDLIMNYKIQF